MFHPPCSPCNGHLIRLYTRIYEFPQKCEGIFCSYFPYIQMFSLQISRCFEGWAWLSILLWKGPTKQKGRGAERAKLKAKHVPLKYILFHLAPVDFHIFLRPCNVCMYGSHHSPIQHSVSNSIDFIDFQFNSQCVLLK